MQQNGLDLDLKFCLRIFVLGVEKGEKNDYTFQKVSVGQCPGGKNFFFCIFVFFSVLARLTVEHQLVFSKVSRETLSSKGDVAACRRAGGQLYFSRKGI